MELTKLIHNVADRIPSLPPLPPKNFFDITGIRNKEVINSKVLSYFLNPKEEHGLNTLFFESILDLINESDLPHIDQNIYSGDFTVEEEEPTLNAIEKHDQKKRIDLVLKGKDWAIIIENKLYHDVINPLDTYWEHLKEYQYKIGIILSLFEIKTEKYKSPGFTFINITHADLVSRVGQNFRFNSNHSEISLFYLKEYFRTIETHYTAKQNAPKMNDIVNKLIGHKEDVNNLLKTLDNANKFVAERVQAAFVDHDFNNLNSLGNLTKIFFAGNAVPDLFFSVNVDKLLTENKLILYLAIMSYAASDSVTDELRNIARRHIGGTKSGNFEVGSHRGKEHTHLLIYTDTAFLQKNENFDQKFQQLLALSYFGDGGLVHQLANHLNVSDNAKI